MSPPLLICAGEASGDRIAAHLLKALGSSVQAVGMGGAGCEQAGMELVQDLSAAGVMGLVEVVRKAWALRRAYQRLIWVAKERRPKAAVLVGFTSFNQRLGRALRAQGIRVLWCVAPQVWAWRPSRLRTLRPSLDRLAVLFPFEEPLWKAHGYDVHYVGHPAIDCTRSAPHAQSPKLLVLCGSRDQEAKALGPVLIDAARQWMEHHPDWSADLVLAPTLSPQLQESLSSLAEKALVTLRPADPQDGAAPLLHHYSLALCASGTACLEAALAAVPPVVTYRVHWLTALVAKALLKSKHIALPNILLGSRHFPELVQHHLSAQSILEAADGLAHGDHEQALQACLKVRQMLEIKDGLSFGKRLAGVLEPLL